MYRDVQYFFVLTLSPFLSVLKRDMIARSLSLLALIARSLSLLALIARSLSLFAPSSSGLKKVMIRYAHAL